MLALYARCYTWQSHWNGNICLTAIVDSVIEVAHLDLPCTTECATLKTGSFNSTRASPRWYPRAPTTHSLTCTAERAMCKSTQSESPRQGLTQPLRSDNAVPIPKIESTNELNPWQRAENYALTTYSLRKLAQRPSPD
jgi:hypothetical protein